SGTSTYRSNFRPPCRKCHKASSALMLFGGRFFCHVRRVWGMRSGDEEIKDMEFIYNIHTRNRNEQEQQGIHT
ncbi:hypothetical protein M9458_038567, partial [Cirrhinus mrigala]